MVDRRQMIDLSRELEVKALLFEEALHRFCDAMSPTSTEATIEAPSSSSVKCGQDALAGDAPSHRASVLHDPACLRHLLAHISNLRNEIAVFREATASGEGATAAVSSHPSLRLPLLPSAGSLCRPPADRNWIHHHLHHHAHPATTASAPPHRCPPVPARPIAPSDVPMQEDGLAAFLSTVDAALGACDVVTPGVRTGAPPNPSLSSIRQSRETCLAVWQEFYLSRRNSLPAEVRLQLRQPTFNNWSHSDAQLLRFVRFFFTGDTTDSELCDERLQLTRLCGIPEEVLDAWLCVVYANYNAVQFHNFKHAFMVTQMMYASIHRADLARLFDHLDLFTLLFSAICHDLDHPGLTNTYQNNAQTQLSMCYNTLSPLENHHCAVAFELVHTPATNIFVNFCDKEFATVRQNTVRCILGTDMAKHTDILEAFTAKMVEHSLRGENSEDNQSVTTVDAVNGVTAPNFSQLAAIFDDDDESHTLTMVVLLKMCDISTEIRPDEVAQPWLDGLINELAAQRDLERVSGLPLSPVMDKSNLVDCQVKFLSFAMLPLAELLISIIPALKSCFLIPTQKQLAHYRQKQKMVADSDEQPSEMEETVATSAKAAETNDDVEDDASEAALPVAILPISLNNCFAVSHSLTTEHHNSHPFPSDGCVDEEANLEGVSTSPALAIPNSMDFLSTHLHNSSGADRQGISASNPDRESAYHQPHSHHQRTSIVSSAGLIAAELAPPHRPLRRSLGELPWSTHALLLTPLEGGYCIAQPHQPPNTASRMSGEFCLSRTDESKTCP